MDLEALPPEDPTPSSPPAWGPAPGWQPGVPAAEAGPPTGPGDPPRGPDGPPPPAQPWQSASPPPGQPGQPTPAPALPWQPAPWQAPTGGTAWGPGGGASWGGGDGGSWGPGNGGSTGGEEPPAKQPRLSRSTKIVGGVVAVAMVAGGAWAAGTALHSSPSTVNFAPAAASTTGGTTNGSTAPGTHRGAFGMGGAGTVATVDAAGNSFSITRPARPPKGTAPNGTAPTTPGNAAPATPSTTTNTVKVTGSTTYDVTEAGTPSDIATGMRIAAFGQVGTNGTITASAVNIADASIGKPRNGTPPNNGTPNNGTPNNGTPPNGTPNNGTPNNGTPNNGTPANRPFAIGTVKTVTNNGDGSVTVVVTGPRGGDRTVVVNSSSKVIKTVKGSFSDVKVGDVVFARGTRNSDGTVTASVVQVISGGLKAGPGFGRGFGPGFAPGFGPGPGFGRHGFGPGGPGGPGGPNGPGGAGGPGHWSPGEPEGSSSPTNPSV